MFLNTAKINRVILLCCMYALPCYALEDDKLQLLHLSADHADLNQKAHEGLYKGQVEFDQGTTHLRADEAITYTNKENKLVKAVAKGYKTPAHFWTLPKKDEPELHAYASEITYCMDTHQITLRGNARILQGKNSFKAPEIIINTETQHIQTRPLNGQRTKIVFFPKDKKA